MALPPYPTNGNGHVYRWLDAERQHAELRAEWHSALADTTRRRDAQMEAVTKALAQLAASIDILERQRDEARGAWRLVMFLSGGSLIASIAAIVAILRP